MKNLYTKLLRPLFIALVAAFWACGGGEKTLVIVSTNDMHANLDRFPQLATVVDSLRAAHGEILLIDAGDRWTGNPYVDLAEERGYPMIEMMNRLGFDLSTFGNHEFDFGIDVLARNVGRSDFPYVVANIEGNGSIEQPAPYIIFEKSGMKIALIGVVTNAVNGFPDGKPESFADATFFSPYEAVKKYAYLRDSVDVLAALTHIGYEEDTIMTVEVPQLDLIIGGHSHTTLDGGVWFNDVLVTQTGSRLENVGVTTIVVKKGKIIRMDNRLIPLKGVRPDPVYADMLEGYKDNPALNEPIGMLASSLNLYGMLNMFSDIVRQGLKGDVMFFNVGSMRVREKEAGGMSVADIFAAEPFANRPSIVYMTLDDIKGLILNKFNSTGKEGHTVDLYPSGLTYEIVTDGEGSGTDVFFKTSFKPVDGKLYKVVLSDYVAAMYEYPRKGTGVAADKLITELVIEYFQKHSPVTATNDPRVVIGR